MNNSKNHRGKLRSSAHNTTRVWAPSARNALWRGGASFLALTIGLTVAGAIKAADAPVEEIVVTGIRKGIEDALTTKRTSNDIVEAISAEDIGKLPDESIADSIARLPGLAAQRNNSGRVEDISVRGLPPAMTTALLNGREQTSTSNNRDVQFDQYPAELMSQVVVYKSGDAAVMGAGISTVDMRTIRPLDYGKQALSMGAQGEYAAQGDLNPGTTSPWGHRENVTYIDQFAHNTLGILLAYAHTDSPQEIISQHSWGFSGNNTVPGGGLQDWLISDNLERDGYATSVQWKPTNRLEVVVDGFYTRYNDDKLQRGVEGPIGTVGGVAPTIAGNSESYIMTPQIENYDYKEKATLRSVGSDFKYKITDNWHTDLDLNYNSAYRRLPEIEIYSGFGINGAMNVNPTTITAPSSAGGIIQGSGQNFSNTNIYALGENLGWANYYPNTSYVTPAVAAAWGNLSGNFNKAGAADYKIITTKDTIKAAKWDLSRDMDEGPFSTVSLGVNYSDRLKYYTYDENAAYLNSLNESQPVPAGILQPTASLSPFGYGNVLSIDPVKALTSGLYTMWPRQDRRQYDWQVQEKVTTGYVKADIETQMFGHQLNGNAGLQVVHTQQSVLQYAQNGSWASFTYTPYTVNTDYNDVLPSVNLIYHLDGQQELRLGLDRSIARPRMDTMAGQFTVNFNTALATSTTTSPWSASAGNPRLKPWVSDDVDLSYTKYLDKDDYVSIAPYYKNLETFVYDAGIPFDFHGFVVPNGLQPVIFTGLAQSYKNGNGGSIFGTELSGNFSLRKIHPALEGFGLQGNIAGNYSSIKIPRTAGNTSPNGQVPELSKWTGSMTFYYQRGGFEARINDRYRSSYVQEVPNFDGSLQSIQGAAENIVDMQVSYSWEEGPMKGLGTSFSVSNLTNEPQNSYYGSNPHQPDYYKEYGTTMLFGVSYKL